MGGKLASVGHGMLRFADRIVAALGVSGTNVLIRLSAFILLCIGIQIAWHGYSALVSHP